MNFSPHLWSLVGCGKARKKDKISTSHTLTAENSL